MIPYFNVAGPCIPGEHYMLPAQDRCAGIPDLIDQKQYFVIHAARQSGKTTLLKELTKEVNAVGKYHALYCSLESIDKIPDPERGIPSIVKKIQAQISFHPSLHMYPFAQDADYTNFTNVLNTSLSRFCEFVDKPLVMFVDEVDCLSNGTLIAFLRQLRDGYVNRAEIPFVHSVALVGMRNIRDYKSRIRDEEETLGTASPFNIVKRTLTLRNFTHDEISVLYAQHATATSQTFPPEVVTAVYDATQGQPWLVNAIACEIVENILRNDVSQPILPTYVEQAVEAIIRQREMHLDSLMKRLSEKRVQRIVEPVILGDPGMYDIYDDDYRYVLDLGLLVESPQGLVVPANRIYGEVMIRTLNSRAHMAMRQQQYPPELPAYLTDGRLDMNRLLTDFQVFWRENSDIWQERFDYKEAAPHLVLQAFLQRVLNGGGRLLREMASGRKRLDLCVEYQGQRYPIELKVRRDTQTEKEGIAQLAGYIDTLGCAEGWLLLVDQRTTVAWDAKLFWRTSEQAGKTVHVVGC
jgi:hypothetical protein